jgi:hypothetical protein
MMPRKLQRGVLCAALCALAVARMTHGALEPNGTAAAAAAAATADAPPVDSAEAAAELLPTDEAQLHSLLHWAIGAWRGAAQEQACARKRASVLQQHTCLALRRAASRRRRVLTTAMRVRTPPACALWLRATENADPAQLHQMAAAADAADAARALPESGGAPARTLSAEELATKRAKVQEVRPSAGSWRAGAGTHAC